MFRRLTATLLALAFVGSLAACGDTWRGAKRDTGQNLEATGNAIEKAGEKVKE
ncbi:MAG: hypothetical protein RIM84_06605 [Alphaproteobacteria bacterium]